MLGNKFFSALFAIVFIMLFAGCAVEGPPAQPSSTAAASGLRSISVSPTNPSIASNTHQQFIATGTYLDNSTRDITGLAYWSSSAANIATISSSAISRGLASALTTSGTTTISASYAGRTGSTRLSVTTAVIESIVVTPANPSMPNGAILQFTATGNFDNGTSQDITTSVSWTSDAQAVATISNRGVASAVGEGSSIITASFSGSTGSATLTVLPPTLTSISVTPVNPSIFIGTTSQFTATGHYDNNTTQDLTDTTTWSSSALGVATISSSGLATALSAGEAVIRATSGGITGITGTTTLAVTTSGTIGLTWDAPTYYTDGSALVPASDLQTYNVYYRTASQAYSPMRMFAIANPGTLSVTYPVVLAPGTYSFVVTAVTLDNLESDYSNEFTAPVN